MDCCSCFEFLRSWRSKSESPSAASLPFSKQPSQEHLLSSPIEELESVPVRRGGKPFCNSNNYGNGKRDALPIKQAFKELKASKEVSEVAAEKSHVKETFRVVYAEDFGGNKTINEYVKVGKIGSGSYGKVVLHRSLIDNKLYAIKVFHRSRLRKIRVAPSETAMTDVLREVDIMKQLDHPNIVRLIEVINDIESDHFYMVLEYIEGRGVFEGSGPLGGVGEAAARRYLRDVTSGLMYLHSHNIVHGDIKPENLLITGEGRIKIGDFSVSRIFESDDDTLRRSPGTPVFTAPECCLGVTYHGKAADVWALGVSLYCMVFGAYPFIGDTLQETYDKIVRQPLHIPENTNPDIADLLQGLLCKDPDKRIKLDRVAHHPWLIKNHGPLQQEVVIYP